MSTNESQGKGVGIGGVPPKTIANAMGSGVIKNSADGVNFAEEVARIHALNEARVAERKKRAEEAELARGQRQTTTSFGNEVQSGPRTISDDSSTWDTDPARLTADTDGQESDNWAASPEALAKSFERLRTHVEGQKNETSSTTSESSRVLPQPKVGISSFPTRTLPKRTSGGLLSKQPQHTDGADAQFDETGQAFSKGLAELRKEMAKLSSSGSESADFQAQPQMTGKQKVEALRKIFRDFHEGKDGGIKLPTAASIPTLTERFIPSITSENIPLDSPTVGKPFTKVDIPLEVAAEHVELPLGGTVGDSNSYVPTFPVGLSQDTPDTADETSPIVNNVEVPSSPTPQITQTPPTVEPKEHKHPVLHRRKVVRGNFFNLGIKKATQAFQALTNKLSGLGKKEEVSHTKEPNPPSVMSDDSLMSVSASTLEEFRAAISEPHDGSVVDHHQKANKEGEATHDSSPHVASSTKSSLEKIEDDEDDEPETSQDSWGSLTRAFKKESDQTKQAKERAQARREKREQARNTPEKQKARWLERQEKIEKMITGEEEVDQAVFTARFQAIDKKTKSLKEGVLETIGKEGMKLLSMFDKGADYLKKNVSTKTRVMAGAGMLAAAGVSLYAAPVFATGAAISVVGAGMRIVTASGTYLTARALFEKMYEKAEQEGRAYGNTEKALFGVAAILGSATLGMAVGQIFEHVFPAEKIVQALEQAGVNPQTVPPPTAEIVQTAPSPEITPVPDSTVAQTGLENAVSLIPLELTEHVVKSGENLWSIIGDIMKQANFEGYNTLDTHARDMKILEAVGHIMKDPQSYGISGGDVNHIASGAKLHLANAFIK